MENSDKLVFKLLWSQKSMCVKDTERTQVEMFRQQRPIFEIVHDSLYEILLARRIFFEDHTA